MAGHEDEPALVGEADQLERPRPRRRRAASRRRRACRPRAPRRRARSASRPAWRSRRRRRPDPRARRSKLGRRRRPPGSAARSSPAAPARRSQTTTTSASSGTRGGCGRGSGPSSRGRRRRPQRTRSRRVPLVRPEQHAAASAAGARGRGRATSCARRHVHVERLAERRVGARGHLPEAGHARPGRGSARSGAAAKCSISYGRHGRGPTSDMSPRRTLKSCGSSSRLVFRSQRPNGVIASSALELEQAVRRSGVRLRSIVCLMYSRCGAVVGVDAHRPELQDRELAHVLARAAAAGRTPGRASRA